MKRKSFDRTVLDDAKAKIEVAEKVWIDFAGLSQRGLTLTIIGDHVIVDDGQDRWLATMSDYQDALNTVLVTAIEKGYDLDESDAYDDLCSACPAMYSNIGCGEYNNKKEELLVILRESHDEAEIEQICDELLINLQENCG